MDIRCSRDGTKCDGCPIMEECEKVELTDEVDLFKIYNQALDDLQKMIDDEYYDGGYGDYHEVEMIVRMIERLKK